MQTILNQNTEFKARVSLAILITIAAFLFLLLCYSSIKDSAKKMQEDVNNKFDYIESSISLEINNAKHLIHALATSLSQELITYNNERIDQIVDKFNYSFKNGGSDLLIGLIILNQDGIVVSNTATPEFKVKLKKTSLSQCSEEAKNNFFELGINPIRLANHVKELIIPLNMKISNFDHQYVGIICSGLKVQKLNNLLSMGYAKTKYFSHIKLKNNVNYNQNEADKQFTIRSTLKNYLTSNYIIVHRALKNYPLLVEMRIEPIYLEKLLGTNFLLYTGFLAIFIIFISISWRFARIIFQDHLLIVQKKLHILNELTKEKPTNKMKLPVPLELKQFCPNQFAKNVNDLIDHHYLLFEELKKKPELEAKQKILNLVLMEKHFLSSTRSAITHEEKLYHNKLASLIDEKYTTASLVDYLKEAVSYCYEFYHEFSIKVVVNKKDQRNFTFKHAALTEVLFHIFTFMSRGSLYIDGTEVILKGSFIDKNNFPKITVEATMPSGDLEALGWSFGPSYAYTSLLSIYLLAKENKLYFDMVKKDNKIIFILEPIDKKIDFYNKAFQLETLNLEGLHL